MTITVGTPENIRVLVHAVFEFAVGELVGNAVAYDGDDIETKLSVVEADGAKQVTV